MSRPKYYWYGIANKMVRRYRRLKNSKPMENKFKKAIERQIIATLDTDEGTEKMKAVEAVCFDQRLNTRSASEELHYSERTIQRWISEFVNDVGKRVGF